MKTANSTLSDLPPLKRGGNIIYFPGTWQEEAPEQPPLPQYDEHCEGFKGVDFGSIHDRILWALYYLRIHSLNEKNYTVFGGGECPGDKRNRKGE
jgi:hypothetical protein